MAPLKRDDVLALKLRHEDVEISPGVEVRVWEMSAASRLTLEEKRSDGDGLAMLLRACLGDETGRFDPPLSVDEVNSSFGMAAQLRLAKVARRLNVMSAEAMEEARGS